MQRRKPLEAVVLAAGEGRRLRPLSERWPKPILPIDGRPVVATLLRELAAAGVRRATVVTGHLAEQVESLIGNGAAFGLEACFVRQPRPDGSADAVVRADVPPPFLVTAADTVYRPGDVRRFVEALATGEAGAIAVRSQPGRPAHTRTRVEDGLVVRVVERSSPGDLTAAPLMLIGNPVAERLPAVTAPPYRPPYELAEAFQLAIDAGHAVQAIEISPTRDLTSPVDLIEHNFGYL